MHAELLSRPVNFAVVQLPERRFPGVVFQGDTLHALTQQVDEILELLRVGDFVGLVAELEDVSEKLRGAQTHYEHVCSERGIALPY